MTWLDLVISILLVYGLIRGIMRGFIFELISSVSLIVGLWIALKSSDALNAYLVQKHIISEKLSQIWAFILVFVLVIALLYFIGKFMEQILKAAQLNTLNRILGGGFGLLKLSLVILVLVHYLEKLNNTMPLISLQIRAESLLYGPCLKILTTLKSLFF